MIGSDHAVEGACDAFWSALFQAIGETLPQADSTDPDCVRSSSTAPGQGAQSLRSLPGASSTRPTDRHEPNSAPTPNAGEDRRECVESLNHPTPAGLGVPATTPSPARSLLPQQADDECRGVRSDGVVPSSVGAIPLGRSGRTAPPTLHLPDEADDEHRGSSSGAVPREEARRYGWREPGTPAVLLLPAPTGRTEWA